MLVSPQEQRLCRALREFPARFDFRYTDEASHELIRLLFQSLALDRDEYLRLFFPQGPPPKSEEPWSLRKAQGAVEGAEYTEAARGQPCGHIFKSGEATYRCKTCTVDDTCVLCARCFDASDHEGHIVYVSVSPGNSGCCDCGDEEAWIRPVHCNIHSVSFEAQSKAAGKAKEGSTLPEELLENIRITISRALDYLMDVFSCSPEQLRLPKTEQSIMEDERQSRLTPKWYAGGDRTHANEEYALVLWNDEKHTVYDIRDQISRACKQRKNFGLAKAYEVSDVGRSVIVYSTDLQELLRMAKIIEEIKLTVTIRSARDTFREQMCGTIIEWISDIAGCSVGSDHQVLRSTLCEEMLKPWRIGSEAHHQHIGRDGIDDHEVEERDEEITFINRYFVAQRRAATRDQQRQGEDDDSSDDDTYEEYDETSAGDAAEDMDLDDLLANDGDGDVDMDASDGPDDELEVSEATIAGYPPPPPPPPPPPTLPAHTRAPLAPRQEQDRTPADSDTDIAPHLAVAQAEPSIEVPKTPRARPRSLRPPRPPKYWLEKPEGYGKKSDTPPHEDLWQRLRLDFMILYDLRMWKKIRIDMRDVFISTVVTIPHFKRLLGLRFAGVYTTLAQLYLIADREPDHSIINLSLQMLTTPSITAEVVDRGNFLTNLMAILYTFLTTRQVGYPWDVNPKATLAFEQGAVTNRRMYHFFLDMKYLIGSDHVKERLCDEERYLMQFLDLVKLHQGICPNVRAVGEHLEYETDAWISASLITREINKLCRQFSEAFTLRRDEDAANICRAIRRTAKVAITNSIGAERKRFDQAEIRAETRFRSLEAFEFDSDPTTASSPVDRIVDFVVAKEPMSFHHALHYTLSWLIDRGKSMSRDQLWGLLLFSVQELREPPIPLNALIPEHQPDEYLLALFDFPLRVCAWLSQMRGGIWVRNGITLRHQMSTYRNVGQRDVSYQRDIFLLQTALVICNPATFLASMVDRFGLMHWAKGHYANTPGIEDSQIIDVVEDFVHLLIILLSDRLPLLPIEDEPEPHVIAMRRDIAHVLCFKPLSFSELTARISERIQDMNEFNTVLSDMTKFKPPEGLSDSGTFELKEEFITLIDPYITQYNRNQREEAETIYKNYMAKKTGKQAEDIVFEPKLRDIPSGVFTDLAAFTKTPLFAQIIYYLLGYGLQAEATTPTVPLTRVEGYLQFVLQLVLVAILEDKVHEDEMSDTAPGSFVANVLTKHANVGIAGHSTILSVLNALTGIEAFTACEPKIKLIIHRLKQHQRTVFQSASTALNIPIDRMDTASPASFVDAVVEKDLKKKQAQERKDKVMAAFKAQQGEFLANQSIDWGADDSDDLDDDFAPVSEKTVVKFPGGNCILCQEETNEHRLYGTFAYIAESTILRQTDTKDEDWVTEVSSTPTNLDRSADSIRPFGVAGQNRRVVEKVTSEGNVIITERQELGKGFPHAYTRRGPVTTGCGHIMHFNCFDAYTDATKRRHVNQIARNHPERPDVKEFLCPLCKALGNVFLPIIWKGKTVEYPGILEPEIPFSDWIGSSLAVQISKLDKTPEKSRIERQQSLFMDYGNEEMIPQLASRLPELMKASFISTPPVPQPAHHHRFQVPAFLPLPTQEDHRDPIVIPSEGHPDPAQSLPLIELNKIYQRLKDSMRANGLQTRFAYPHTSANALDDLTYTDTLARALGYSISAVEIAQRGVESPNPRTTLLDKIPPQSIAHLRIFSETVSSYFAVGGLRNSGASKTCQEFMDSRDRQLHQLFVGHPKVFPQNALPYEAKGISALLYQDPFVFLSECAVCCVPSHNLDIFHMLRLCYLAELVRVVIAYAADDSSNPFGSPEEAPLTDIPSVHGHWQRPGPFINPEKSSASRQEIEELSSFVGHIVNTARTHDYPSTAFSGNDADAIAAKTLGDEKFFHFMHTMMESYALPFLRKAAILLNVRFGVEFPPTPNAVSEEREIVRLTSVLKLPSLHEMFRDFSADNPGGEATRATVSGWLRHWCWSREGKRPARPTISLAHPTIFELVGLPRNYDTLTDEAVRRKCPTTGKELTDPCVCLFCGEIFCSQGVCCMKDRNKGGCFQHQTKCGGNIGLFINIRKCMVLFMNMSNGTWAVAPYLDKHGEVDPTLRRHHQLFLNQKRYDHLLRQVWLHHGVPSMIARRLEGDVNNGGWETL
ncbi:uncharacterized protein BDZ99DRAFT_420298 [Mytilinidion resinicola]|uniref:E3 ubiquitin-protein ligase n=1 Tax=Mytilinidion resinicola TaxID=574789 RepID=A0A6A6YII6_9PEZI|nr:uncharacterized protein BDZ99DRAFT_420298 [Mytilinidion resinicola]KAF2807775.1 hypothetical protein BDZ99DRAFT_420298 [Mytilinidion resinicola]